MINFQEVFDFDPDVINRDSIEFRPMAVKVKKQAVAHLRRDSHGELLKNKRPSEQPDVYAYRMKNARSLTKCSLDWYMDLVSQMFTSKTFKVLNASDNLDSFLNTKTSILAL